MDTAQIRKNYQGRWLYQGQAKNGFDEVELIIDDQDLVMIKRVNGQVVSRRRMSSRGQFFGEELWFGGGGHPTIFVSYASEDVIVFGELKGAVAGDVVWSVKADRIA